MIFSLLFLWCPVLISTTTASVFQTHYCDLNTTNHIMINNTRYYSNLIQVLNSLASDTSVNDKQFVNRSSLIPLDIAYGLYLCWADILTNDCRNCLLEAPKDMNNTCMMSKAAVFWRDTWMIRYANYSMFSTMNFDGNFTGCDQLNISDQDTDQNKFWQSAMNLMHQLANHASMIQKEMFAYDALTYNKSRKIYGYVQCTPDLSGSDCNKCLQTCIARLGPKCYGKQGARVGRELQR